MSSTQNNARRLRAQAKAYIENKQPGKALRIYVGLLESDPNDSNASFELAVLYHRLGRHDEAIGMLQQTLSIDPNHYPACMILASNLQGNGQLAQAITFYDRALRLKRGTPINEHGTFAGMNSSRAKQDDDSSHTSLYKLKHDSEQLRYLIDAGCIPVIYEDVAHEYDDVRKELESSGNPNRILGLSKNQIQRIGDTYNKFLYNSSAPMLASSAVNPDLDGGAIERKYNQHAPGFAHIDNFLTTEALQGIRRFCLESTIWYPYKYPGYTGAFVNEGFSCGLLIQISEELRRLLPTIIRDYPLRQMWAYKYDSQMEGIALHADAAAVNVNFWITPDEACLQPDTSGLRIFLQEAPDDWDFHRFNSDSLGIRKFLDETDNRYASVPYKQNRAIVFHSNLFHQTEYFHFKEGYENRRINITLLYGDRC